MRSLILLMLTSVLLVFGEEGMWLPTQIKDLPLKEKGMQIEAAELFIDGKPKLAKAVVNLGGGTAELVSKDGLLLTNHHVAFGAVQRASTKGTNYIEEGFLAKTREDEIQAPGYYAKVLKEVRDVTDAVIAVRENIDDPVERRRAVKTKIKEMEEQIEGDRDDLDANIAEMYNGRQYLLYLYQRFDDIRIVYVPPKSIGNYGGDVDNWMWPRHTGDFAFMRIYMSPEGRGREYNENNVPYQAEAWLKIASQPLKPGDFTFIMGYPGRTTRYRTSYSVDYYQNYHYPNAIENYKELVDMLEQKSDESKQVAVKVASLIKGLNNVIKNYKGNLDGMREQNFFKQKQAFEQDVRRFIQKDPQHRERFGNLFKEIEAVYDKINAHRERDFILGSMRWTAGTLTSMANNIMYVAHQRALPEDERDPEFSEKDVQRRLQRLKFSYMNYNAGVDQMLFTRMLNKVFNLPEKQRIETLQYVQDEYESLDRFVQTVFENTQLDSVAHVKSLYDKSLKELQDSDDPLLKFAEALYPEFKAKRERDRMVEARLTELRRKYMTLLKSYQDEMLYPDANGTMRFTYGYVKGYSPKDAVWYKPFTTLSGVMEKDTGEPPFDVPETLKTLHSNNNFGGWEAEHLKDVPVAFTHTCDITGGNSGSPVLNARGNLVGIAFDGNYEALISDWKYLPDIQRTISVDIRYVLFITEKFGQAERILKEIGVK